MWVQGVLVLALSLAGAVPADTTRGHDDATRSLRQPPRDGTPAAPADPGTGGHGDARTGDLRYAAFRGFPASSRFLPSAASVPFAPAAASAAQAWVAGCPEDAPFSASPCRRVPASLSRRLPASPGRLSPASAFLADTPVTARTRHPEPDPWLGEDKLKHFLASFFVMSAGYSGARMVGFGHRPAIVAAAGAGVLAGVAKEARDRITGGDVSARDLTWDAAGIVAGAVLVAHTR